MLPGVADAEGFRRDVHGGGRDAHCGEADQRVEAGHQLQALTSWGFRQRHDLAPTEAADAKTGGDQPSGETHPACPMVASCDVKMAIAIPIDAVEIALARRLAGLDSPRSAMNEQHAMRRGQNSAAVLAVNFGLSVLKLLGIGG